MLCMEVPEEDMEVQEETVIGVPPPPAPEPFRPLVAHRAPSGPPGSPRGSPPGLPPPY